MFTSWIVKIFNDNNTLFYSIYLTRYKKLNYNTRIKLYVSVNVRLQLKYILFHYPSRFIDIMCIILILFFYPRFSDKWKFMTPAIVSH